MKAETLKKSILQYAMEGKLVPQDPNDEPASELLKRIKAEKEQLIKEGKIKKDKTESYIFKGEDDIDCKRDQQNSYYRVAEIFYKREGKRFLFSSRHFV